MSTFEVVGLVTALASGHAQSGALIMLAFGLGTLPNLLLAGIVLARLNESGRLEARQRPLRNRVLYF